ncbi:MAG TPA: alpha/beta hydrolase [Mucilaginibacter sp.]|nr:alpha/beta hydrolase [Mucilaginibacter sp.]
MEATNEKTPSPGAYAVVNGLRMYYEIHGSGAPLVLLHGGGSTIGTNFGRVLPLFAKNRRVIAVELQAHGRSGDRDAPETFAQDAADVAELLTQLEIPKADVLGFSNGGQTAIELGVHYPDRVNKLIIASAFYKRSGVPANFWKMFEQPDFNHLPQIYKDEFLKLNNDPEALMNMFNKDAERMLNFTGWQDEELKMIAAPVLVVTGDRDLAFAEHTIEMYRLFRNARLAILPGNHGSYMGEAMTPSTDSRIPEFFAAMAEEFLNDGN